MSVASRTPATGLQERASVFAAKAGRRLFSIEQPMPGVHLIGRLPLDDERGSFCRLFCQAELEELQINTAIQQANLSRSNATATLRGLHYQVGAAAETKIVSCLSGRIVDVIVDLRPQSPAFGQHAMFELSASNLRAVVVPEGCAHGFVTLEPDCAVLYFVSASYDAENERGVRYDDPSLAISWPIEPKIVSQRDQNHPDIDLASALIS